MKARINLDRVPSWAGALIASSNDPYTFVTQVLGVLPFEAENLAGEPALEKWQGEALKAIRDGKLKLSIRSGHGVGKGAFISWLVLWGLLTFQEVKIVVGANTQNQLRDNNWPEITKWHKKLPPAIQELIVLEAEKIYYAFGKDARFA